MVYFLLLIQKSGCGQLNLSDQRSRDTNASFFMTYF